GELWSRQAVVARILRWRQEGLTKSAIAARLNAAHVPPLAGTGRWNLRKVTRALWEVPKNKRERHAFLARYATPNPPALGREGQHTGAPRRSPRPGVLGAHQAFTASARVCRCLRRSSRCCGRAGHALPRVPTTPLTSLPLCPGRAHSAPDGR